MKHRFQTGSLGAFLSTVLIATGVVLSGSEARAQDSNYERYISDKDQIAVVEYFGDMGAFATFVNRGQRAADSYRLPGYDIEPRREACFPGFPGGEVLPQNFPKPDTTRVLDLAGRFAGELPVGAKAEIEGKVKLVQKLSGNVRAMNMESLQPADITKFFSADSCPFLRSVIDQHRADSDRLLIGDVYFVDGDFKVTYELVVMGSLKAEIKNALSALLARIGLKNFSLEGSVNGKIQQVNETSYVMRPQVAAAFRPYYLDAADLKIVYENYLQKGLLKPLKSYVNDETRLRSFLEDFPDIRRRAQTDPLANIAGSQELVPFDRKNETHIEYLSFQTAVSNARRILGLPLVEQKRRT